MGSLLVLLLYKPCDIIIVFENGNILDSSLKLIKREAKLLEEGTLLEHCKYGSEIPNQPSALIIQSPAMKYKFVKGT